MASQSRRKPAARKSQAPRKAPRTTRASKSSDLAQMIAMLEDDHGRVDKLFKKIDKMKESDDDGRHALVKQVCAALKVHAAIEEEVFYPAARDVLADEDDMIDEAEVEHASAKQLIADIEQLETSDPIYDAKVKVLGEYIEHHVQEEEDDMFPKLKKKAGDQFDGLFAQMKEMRAALEADIGMEKPKSKSKGKRARSNARKTMELS